MSKLSSKRTKNFSYSRFFGSCVWFVFLLFPLSGNSSLFSQNTYPTDSVDEKLFQNADAIVRDYQTTFKILGPGNAKLNVLYAITILNENAQQKGFFDEVYHKFKKISNVQGFVYDKNGYLLKELKRQEIQDVSSVSDFSIYDDNRRKYCRPVAGFYPYTVVYQYEIIFDGLFYYPTWYPVPDFNISVEKASFKIEVPLSMRFNFKPVNILSKPKVGTDGINLSYTWNLQDIPAIQEEPLSPDFSTIVPSIYLAPENFKIKGYTGNMDSWQSFGLWVAELNEGRDKLKNKDAVAAVRKMKRQATDTVELIKKIYQYMQSRTRYANIKLGIGSYQPIEADVVHEVGYGDCKALSIYMKALLKKAGIKSHYTLIRSGDEEPDILVDFPSPQFNHAILSVPLENDTVWLECTHQNIPFGYISDANHNRHVLLITDEGGVITKTPKYSLENNLQVQTGKIVIDKTGNARIHVESSMSGLQYDFVSEAIYSSYEDQRNWIYDNLDIPAFKVVDLSFDEQRDMVPTAYLEMTVEIDGYASKTNKRVFVPMNVLNKIQNVPRELKERKSDIIMRIPYTDMDTLVYKIPADGYKIEYWPDDVTMKNEFGYYKVTFNFDKNNNTIKYTRHLTVKDGTYPKEKYDDLVDFLSKVQKLDNTKAVFVKQVSDQ